MHSILASALQFGMNNSGKLIQSLRVMSSKR